MVNKQYNIQKGGKGNKNYSPPPSLRSALSIPLVSSQPNPLQVATNINLDPHQEEKDNNINTVYGRNITYYGDDSIDNGEHLTVKDLSISDIGRFQYVLPVEEKTSVSNEKIFYEIHVKIN